MLLGKKKKAKSRKAKRQNQGTTKKSIADLLTNGQPTQSLISEQLLTVSHSNLYSGKHLVWGTIWEGLSLLYKWHTAHSRTHCSTVSDTAAIDYWEDKFILSDVSISPAPIWNLDITLSTKGDVFKGRVIKGLLKVPFRMASPGAQIYIYCGWM